MRFGSVASVASRRRACTLAVTTAHWTAFACVAGALASGCATDAYGGPPAPVATGATVMDWTIDGTKDPARCRTTGAATFHVALYGSNNRFAGEYVQDCTVFATTIAGLAADTYTGKADLLDSGGQARTTSVDLAAFQVIARRSVTVGLDFPSNSFY